MNRAFYIAAIAFSIIFFFVCGYYVTEVSFARSYYAYSSYSNMAFYNSSINASSLTAEAAAISLFFFLAFITTDLLGLIKVKTKTMKTLAIIGISISGLFLFWDLAVLASPGSLSFDEVGVAFMFYCIIMLAFSIVGLVQSVRYANMKKRGGIDAKSKDLLDS